MRISTDVQYPWHETRRQLRQQWATLISVLVSGEVIPCVIPADEHQRALAQAMIAVGKWQ